MKKPVLYLITFLSFVVLSSFIGHKENFIGSYGDSIIKPSHTKLIINADHTFYYEDFSVDDQKLIVKGVWEKNGRKVVLKGNSEETKFHNVWTFDQDGQVAKSRKGINFYRLIRIGD